MPRRPRNYAAEYARRQARARQRGFESYYARRVRGGAAATPETPAPRGERLRRLRGHASGADMRREAGDGAQVTAQLGGRDGRGRYHRVDVTVIDPDGREHEYQLQGRRIERDYLEALVADLDARGIIFSPAPSLDLRKIAEDASERPPLYGLLRGERWLVKLNRAGAVVTSKDAGLALTFAEPDDAERFLRRHRLDRFPVRRRFSIEPLEPE
jgi:hypothetical protein